MISGLGGNKRFVKSGKPLANERSRTTGVHAGPQQEADRLRHCMVEFCDETLDYRPIWFIGYQQPMNHEREAVPIGLQTRERTAITQMIDVFPACRRRTREGREVA